MTPSVSSRRNPSARTISARRSWRSVMAPGRGSRTTTTGVFRRRAHQPDQQRVAGQQCGQPGEGECRYPVAQIGHGGGGEQQAVIAVSGKEHRPDVAPDWQDVKRPWLWRDLRAASLRRSNRKPRYADHDSDLEHQLGPASRGPMVHASCLKAEAAPDVLVPAGVQVAGRQDPRREAFQAPRLHPHGLRAGRRGYNGVAILSRLPDGRGCR